jgi:hypothetical protein
MAAPTAAADIGGIDPTPTVPTEAVMPAPRPRRVPAVRRALAASLLPVLVLAFAAAAAAAQSAARIEARPASLALTRGQSAVLELVVLDASGTRVGVPLRVAGARDALDVEAADEADPTTRWRIAALDVGEHEVVVTTAVEGAAPLTLRVPVRVTWPAVARVEVTPASGALYDGTRLRHRARVVHDDGTERPNARVVWSTSDPAIATVDAFGNVRAQAAGRVDVVARIEGVEGRHAHDVRPLAATSLELSTALDGVRTGDVQSFTATARDAQGRAIADVPVTWSHLYAPDDSIQAPQAPGQIEAGRYVAYVPGVHTVVASAGPLRAEASFRVTKRDVVRKVQVLGQGREARVFTTDFWAFQGVDGRDYAFTGSKFGDGIAFVFDITDPANIVKTDSIRIDARTVNDVKVSPDGRYAALSREGASNRRNGVVLLDLRDPAHPVVASVYDDDLTGGVHNMFATNDHLFALSAGDKYVILDVRDLTRPRYVSEYDHPGSRVHDVWVHDGVAYSAEWETGVVVVDVGNGRWGGTIEQPKLVTSFPLPTGSTHAVFPYHQRSTGKFYLFVGDERVQRRGLAWEGSGPDHRQKYDPTTGTGGYPRATSGYIQVVDFTDPASPRMVARYEVPEFGTHNMWVADDILYQAYYEGGVRMVDVSGDLMGNLYLQDREIAVFKAHDPIGYIPNAPGAWSVMPHKGNVLFSDVNSGLWSIRLLPRTRPVS